MDPKLYDVNVHPAKAEVRFAFQQEVHRFVSGAVKEALSASKNDALPDLFPTDHKNNMTQSQNKTDFAETTKSNYFSAQSSEDLSSAVEFMYKVPELQSPDSTNDNYSRSQVEIFHGKPNPVANLIYSEFEPLGQLDRSFILMQGKMGILVIDQHVAHERVLYDQFSKAAKNRKIEVQQLLFPLSLEFSHGESELLGRYQQRLGELGLEFESFGKNDFLLRSVPAILKKYNHAEIMREIVDMLPTENHEEVLNNKFEEILIMMSCRNAIKINTTLNLSQISKLISDLQGTSMPYTCPHGRPIALLYEMDTILKKFLRK